MPRMQSFVMFGLAAAALVDKDCAEPPELGDVSLPPKPDASDADLAAFERGEAPPAEMTETAQTDMVRMCCCSSLEPAPKFVCYDSVANTVFEPVVTRKPVAFREVQELSHTPAVLETSRCHDGAATRLDSPARTQGTPQLAYRVPLTGWTTYDGPQSPEWRAEHKNYTVPTGLDKDKHILFNGVIYGPTNKVKEFKDGLHGLPYCKTWEKTVSVSVEKSKATFVPQTNSWSFKPTCEPVTEHCREWGIAHACGFDAQNKWFLKRVGRKGSCLEVQDKKASWLSAGGASCPTGTFNSKVSGVMNWMAAEGGSTFKFCECDAACE